MQPNLKLQHLILQHILQHARCWHRHQERPGGYSERFRGRARIFISAEDRGQCSLGQAKGEPSDRRVARACTVSCGH
eukprot:2157001-Prymnesium_polylepis.1